MWSPAGVPQLPHLRIGFPRTHQLGGTPTRNLKFEKTTWGAQPTPVVHTKAHINASNWHRLENSVRDFVNRR